MCVFVDNDVVVVIIVYILCGSVVVCYCEVEFRRVCMYMFEKMCLR